MSNRRGIFPNRFADSNSYFNTVVAYLNNNDARLQISTTNLDMLNLLYTNPTAPLDEQGWTELWLLHNNDATATKLVTTLLYQRLKAQAIDAPFGMENQLRLIYGDIPQSLLIQTDRSTLNLKQRKTTRSRHYTATTNGIIWSTAPLGGGVVLTKCYPDSGSTHNPLAAGKTDKGAGTRAHKEYGYEIRTAYMLLKLGDPLPAAADAPGMIITIDTKAHLVRSLGAANAGMVLCEFKQWYNPKHPELSGPWEGPKTSIVA